MYRNLRTGFSIALTIFAIGLLLVHGWLRWPYNPVIRFVLAIMLLLLLVWIILKSSDIKEPAVTALGKPIAEPPSAEEIAAEYSAILQNYDAAAVNLFVEILTDPTHYLDRITEFVAIESESPRLQLSSHQVFQLGHSHGTRSDDGKAQQAVPDVLLVPLIWSQRGTLLDHLKVTNAKGESIPTLSYNQTRGLMAYAIEALLDKVPLDPDRLWMESKERHEKQRELLVQKLALAVCSPGPRHKQSAIRQDQLQATLSAIDVFPISDDWRDRIKKFCIQFMDRYVIVAEVRSSGTELLGVTYSHCIPLESPTNYPLNQWRERFGLSPSTIDIVHNPFSLQVAAYHLEISAQPEQYVFDHHLEWIDTHKHVVQGDLRVGGLRPYVRLYHQEGRPNAHLYVRRQTVPHSDSSSASAEGALSLDPPVNS